MAEGPKEPPSPTVALPLHTHVCTCTCAHTQTITCTSHTSHISILSYSIALLIVDRRLLRPSQTFTSSYTFFIFG